MRILFLTHTNIGDAVLSTIVLNRLLNDYPNAVVDVACGAKAVDLFKGLPNIGELVPVIKKKRHAHYFDLWKKFRKYKYDYVVDLRGSALTYFLNKKVAIRFSNKNKKLHKAQQLANLYASELPVTQKVWLDPAVEAQVAEKAATLKADGSVVVGLGPTSNWYAKTWPQRKFAILVNKIVHTAGLENAKFVLFGAPHERRYVEDLIQYIPECKRVDLVGQTSLEEAGAWMQQLDVFVGHDSGLSHLAAALDIPTLTLFGPTSEKLYSPVTDKGRLIVAPDLPAVNLKHHTLTRLITDITPEDVYENLMEVLTENGFVKQTTEENIVEQSA